MIELLDVRKTFFGAPGAAPHRALDGVSLTVPGGRLCVLIGPSGCGKTTLLRLINKLVPLESGTIRIEGRDIAREDAVRLRRRIGYAIQQVGLFPNMTLAQNIAVVPSLERWPRERIAARVEALLDLVGLPRHYGARWPHQLSGGEAQRVGVARALAADPPLLLMDEPFAALDPITRERLQTEFLAIQSRLRKTVLLVSHDLDEALRMGDCIALMRAGRVEQFGTPAEILLHPATPFVREFLGGEDAFARLGAVPVSAALEHAPSAGLPQPESQDVTGALRFAPDTPVGEALLALAAQGQEAADVQAPGGSLLGKVTLRSLARLLIRDREPA